MVASRGHKRWFLQKKVVEGSKNGSWLLFSLFKFLRSTFCIYCRGMFGKCTEGGNLECFVGKGWKNLRRENTIKTEHLYFHVFEFLQGSECIFHCPDLQKRIGRSFYPRFVVKTMIGLLEGSFRWFSVWNVKI